MNEVFWTVLSLSLSGSLLILVLLALRPLLKNRLSKRWQYYIWLVVLARLLLPVTPEASLMGALFQQTEQGVFQTADAPERNVAPALPDTSAPFSEDAALPADGSGTSLPETPPTPGPAAALSHLWMVWLGGALLLFLRKATVYQSFTRYLRAGCTEVSDPALLDLLAEWANRSGIQRPVELYTNPLAATPMLLGFFRPCIVLPSAALPEEELIYTLRHELVHCRRRDILYKWLTQGTICLHWFNPLVWLMGREIDRACELSCDEAVIAQLDARERRAYGDTLLHAAHTGGRYRSLPASLTLHESGALLKERLESIMKFKKRTKWAAALSFALTAALFLGATAAGAYDSSGGSIPASFKGDSPFQSRYTLEGYYEPPYLFELGWNMQEAAGKSYTSTNVSLADGSSMTVYFSDACRALPKDKDAMQSLAALLSRLRTETRDTAFPLMRPLVVSVRDTGDASPAVLAAQYYRDGSLPQFGAVFALADETAQGALLEQIYADEQVAFFSVAVEQFKPDAPLIGRFAEKAYTDGSTSFFSILTGRMGTETLQTWTARAEADGETAFRSILYSARDMDKESEEMKAALDRQRLEEYRALGITVEGKAYYYQGRLVRILLDQRQNSSFHTLEINPEGAVDIRVTRDGSEKITGVRYMTQAEADALLADWDEEEADNEDEPVFPDSDIDWDDWADWNDWDGDWNDSPAISGYGAVHYSGSTSASANGSNITTVPMNLPGVAKGAYLWLGTYDLAIGDCIYYDVSAGGGTQLSVGFAAAENDPSGPKYNMVSTQREDGTLHISTAFFWKEPLKSGRYSLFVHAPDSALTGVKGRVTILHSAMDTLEFKGTTYYLVFNEAQLRAIGTGPYGLDKNYMQQADIPLSGMEWTPIGTEDAPFTGTYNGNGFSITGLTMKDPNSKTVGLFGVARNAHIYNVTLSDYEISAAGKNVPGKSVGPVLAQGQGCRVYDNFLFPRQTA